MHKKLTLHLDEAWRWPLAGPVSVWCALKLKRTHLSDFKDSKVLSEKRREELYEKAHTLQKKWNIIIWYWFSSNTEIDTQGIIPALDLASNRAIFLCMKTYFQLYRLPALLSSSKKLDKEAHQELSKLFRKRKLFVTSRFSGGGTHSIIKEIIQIENSICTREEIIIDGNHTFWLDRSTWMSTKTVIKWDAKIPLISLASIIAKVERDRYMKKVASNKEYMQYQFHQHKGYGTKKHREAIALYGPSSLHRTTFCRNIIQS